MISVACRRVVPSAWRLCPGPSAGCQAAPALAASVSVSRSGGRRFAAAASSGSSVVVQTADAAKAASAHSATPAAWSFGESRDQVALSERQEAFLLERLPRDWAEDDVLRCLQQSGLDLGEDGRSKILLMRTRVGRSLGRVMVASPLHVPQAVQTCPAGATYRPIDRNDVVQFVEQCERLVTLSDDLRRLARPEYFQRIITITEVPESYGRRDVVHVIKERCGVNVDPRNVVFRFKRWGRQSDTCYVICPSVKDADHCVQRIQELAVPKKAAYGSLFGASFLWSSRSTLFLSDPDLDFVLDSKFWVFTTGWQEDMSVDDFLGVIQRMDFRPVRAVRHHIPSDNSSAFFVELENLQRAKRVMVKLRRLKQRWRIKQEMPFFAYPRRIDVHRADEERHEDEDSAEDSDIEEPVHY